MKTLQMNSLKGQLKGIFFQHCSSFNQHNKNTNLHTDDYIFNRITYSSLKVLYLLILLA